jgi:tetratricopeptide (TPR) repeat protein
VAAQEAQAPVTVVVARFLLGFALVLRGRLEEADKELVDVLRAARTMGDVATEVRCLAYLAIAARRAQRVDETRTRAEEALSVADAAGMSDYAAAAQAGLGWAAWRQGNHDDARIRCRAAVESWGRSPAPFPFQWLARLTLLALDVDRAPLDELVASIESLLAPDQMRLPDAAAAALRAVVLAHQRHDVDAAGKALAQACAAAMQLGFL